VTARDDLLDQDVAVATGPWCQGVLLVQVVSRRDLPRLERVPVRRGSRSVRLGYREGVTARPLACPI
jgi:hypothetical protein